MFVSGFYTHNSERLHFRCHACLLCHAFPSRSTCLTPPPPPSSTIKLTFPPPCCLCVHLPVGFSPACVYAPVWLLPGLSGSRGGGGGKAIRWDADGRSCKVVKKERLWSCHQGFPSEPRRLYNIYQEDVCLKCTYCAATQEPLKTPKIPMWKCLLHGWIIHSFIHSSLFFLFLSNSINTVSHITTKRCPSCCI